MRRSPSSARTQADAATPQLDGRLGWIDFPPRTRRSARLEALLLGPAVDAAVAADGLKAELEAERARASRLESELREVAARASHLRFVADRRGYRLAHVAGPPPEPGTTLDGGEGIVYAVAKVGPSPFPGDRRRCAYLELPPEG